MLCIVIIIVLPSTLGNTGPEGPAVIDSNGPDIATKKRSIRFDLSSFCFNFNGQVVVATKNIVGVKIDNRNIVCTDNCSC